MDKNIDSIKTVASVVGYVPRKDVQINITDNEQERLRQIAIDRLISLMGEKTEEIILLSALEKKSELPSFFEIMDSIAPRKEEKPIEDQIKDMKKRIKHCKNFMERKSLEKELSVLYKEKKRRKMK